MNDSNLDGLLRGLKPGSNRGVTWEKEDSNQGVSEKLNSESQRILSDILKGRESSKGRPVVLKGDLSFSENEKRLSLPINLQSAFWKACTQPYGSYPNHLRKVRSAYFILQDGICYFCSKKIESEKESALDHDHKTKKVRGMVHNECNLLIGFIEKFLTRHEMDIDSFCTLWRENATLKDGK